MYVWDHLISKSAAKNVAFIAHGYGGLAFVDLLVQRKQEVMNKVCSVVFIDSVHHIQHQSRRDPQIEEWIRKHCREWVSNSKPLDKPVGSLIKVSCPVGSAGTNKYGLTICPMIQRAKVISVLKPAASESTGYELL
uniref:Arb2 domain-containing protein n=1 Tax=Falco tinnunculus TaxID=100819 RepID=A0A8C4U9Z3_FALTI